MLSPKEKMFSALSLQVSGIILEEEVERGLEPEGTETKPSKSTGAKLTRAETEAGCTGPTCVLQLIASHLSPVVCNCSQRERNLQEHSENGACSAAGIAHSASVHYLNPHNIKQIIRNC